MLVGWVCGLSFELARTIDMLMQRYSCELEFPP